MNGTLLQLTWKSFDNLMCDVRERDLKLNKYNCSLLIEPQGLCLYLNLLRRNLFHLVLIRPMANSLLRTWSNNPNAPDIPHPLYILEKSNLAGIVISSTSYGMSIYMLAFVCSLRLLDSPSQGLS